MFCTAFHKDKPSWPSSVASLPLQGADAKFVHVLPFPKFSLPFPHADLLDAADGHTNARQCVQVALCSFRSWCPFGQCTAAHQQSLTHQHVGTMHLLSKQGGDAAPAARSSSSSHHLPHTTLHHITSVQVSSAVAVARERLHASHSSWLVEDSRWWRATAALPLRCTNDDILDISPTPRFHLSSMFADR